MRRGTSGSKTLAKPRPKQSKEGAKIAQRSSIGRARHQTLQRIVATKSLPKIGSRDAPHAAISTQHSKRRGAAPLPR